MLQQFRPAKGIVPLWPKGTRLRASDRVRGPRNQQKQTLGGPDNRHRPEIRLDYGIRTGSTIRCPHPNCKKYTSCHEGHNRCSHCQGAFSMTNRPKPTRLWW